MRHQCPACESWHTTDEPPVDWKAEHDRLKAKFDELHKRMTEQMKSPA